MTKEELKLQPNEILEQSNIQLREADKEVFSHCWVKENNFLIYVRNFYHINSIDKEKQSFILNHQNRYIKIHTSRNQWKAQVSYFEADVQEIELKLMEKHLDLFYNNLKWYH
ncbi:MAG: hypothetical protein M3342_07030 [Bacteroidota bacterium]|nr:hypothetical protein [Bacteroidota bacterium]